MQMIKDSDEMDGPTLATCLELVHSCTGITMTPAKKTLLQGRLRPRIKKLGIATYAKYIELVKNSKDEKQEFINIVTTHETSFFRTQRVWDYFSKDFLPRWSADNPNKTLKIWSAAASTGEEIYTIAICCEEFITKNSHFSYQILGTDISEDVIAVAEYGEYAGRAIENFKNSNRIVFDKYLEQRGEKYRVKNNLKTKLRFGVFNLYSKIPHAEAYDIVFLRNVLIYFNPSDQSKVLKNIGEALIKSGILIIGESESLNGLGAPFEFKIPLVYSKLGHSDD